MGQCCSCHVESYHAENREEAEREIEHEDMIFRGHAGAHVRLQGSSKFVSMYTQQGKKGANQDAMTVWENFSGAKDTFFCAVFDGHGPSGHKVARYIRDVLPAKLSMLYKSNVGKKNDCFEEKNSNAERRICNDHPFLSSWKDKIIESFHEMDEELEGDASIESYCSGTTSVSILRKGEHLIISNLGDSRAVLCTRDDKDQLIPEQLTVDLKPNLPGEMERIKSCQGRVLAMDKEPNVYRIWMPDEDCPGLAMARAFGDFCLKDFGLISTPEITYRKLTQRDEFVVLATDGIWDVLSNNEVIRIVASAKKRSLAAKLLVDQAVRAWRYKYPSAKIDDCAVICLFFKRPRPLITKSISEVTEPSLNHTELEAHSYNGNPRTDDGLDTVLNCKVEESPETAPNGGGDRLDSAAHRPRKRRSEKKIDQVGD